MECTLVLNVSCFSWSAIFFYVYTSQITFSAIRSLRTTTKSQGEEAPHELSPIEESPEEEVASITPSRAAVDESCSPKSVYALTSKVCSACISAVELFLTPWQIGFTCLRDLAFDNIESQLNEKNIVNELFSPFTVEQVSYLVTSCIPEY